MPRVIVRGWGIVVDFGWGVVDGAIDAARNETNRTNGNTSVSEEKILFMCLGGASIYAAKDVIKKLIIGASPNLLL